MMVEGRVKLLLRDDTGGVPFLVCNFRLYGLVSPLPVSFLATALVPFECYISQARERRNQLHSKGEGSYGVGVEAKG
jgi:hypothetical protein